MSDPETLEEYNEKYAANYKLTGFGLDGMRIHFACPACCAPDFIITSLMDFEKRFSAGAICLECKRGFKAIIIEHAGHTTAEVVQFRGDPPPAFLPHIRRTELKEYLK